MGHWCHTCTVLHTVQRQMCLHGRIKTCFGRSRQTTQLAEVVSSGLREGSDKASHVGADGCSIGEAAERIACSGAGDTEYCSAKTRCLGQQHRRQLRQHDLQSSGSMKKHRSPTIRPAKSPRPPNCSIVCFLPCCFASGSRHVQNRITKALHNKNAVPSNGPCFSLGTASCTLHPQQHVNMNRKPAKKPRIGSSSPPSQTGSPHVRGHRVLMNPGLCWHHSSQFQDA